jgi:hypothetical protein
MSPEGVHSHGVENHSHGVENHLHEVENHLHGVENHSHGVEITHTGRPAGAGAVGAVVRICFSVALAERVGREDLGADGPTGACFDQVSDLAGEKSL